MQQAERIGVRAALIETGESSVRRALAEAVRSIRVKQEEQVKAEMHCRIIKNVAEGLLFVNREGRIGVDNGAAQKMGDGNPCCGRRLREVFPVLVRTFERVVRTRRDETLDVLTLRRGRTVSVTITPVVSGTEVHGAVINLKDVSRIQELEGNIRARLCEKGLQSRHSFDDIVYESAVMRETVAAAKRFAAAGANVVIIGETGTGKELFAQSIHHASPRSCGPFVAVNCAALPESLLESELFGYVDGAFTGARKGGKMGLVEQAHRGTLFLDEISEIPMSLQSKLLRVLQEREVRRVGADAVIHVDVRIIAATNRSLAVQVREGTFRRDLLYRLDVLRLFLPPLRDRAGDVDLLFDRLRQQFAQENNAGTLTLSLEARALLHAYPFAGNIRELRNLAERSCILYAEGTLSGAAMRELLYPRDISPADPDVSARAAAPTRSAEEPPALIDVRAEAERAQLRAAWAACGGNRGDMAAMLCIDRSTLWRKLKKYHMI